jgi:uncharacterized membrane protein
LIGILIGWPLMIGTGIWVLYRIARGWLNLLDGKPMPTPN